MLPAIGFNLDLHWCGNKVKLVSFDSAHEIKCPCSKKMPLGCCKDVHVSVKLTDNHKTASQLNIPNNIFVTQLSAVVSLPGLIPSSQFEVFVFTKYHDPPFKSELPVYLTNNIFRI